MMSGGALSQDEINALLSAGVGLEPSEEVSFSSQQISRIQDLCTVVPSIIQTSAASMMSDAMTVALVDVTESNKEKALGFLDERILDLSLSFTSGVSGGHFFIANEKDVLPVAAAIVGQEVTTLEGAALVAFSELFHQVGQSFATNLSTTLSKTIEVGIPNAQVVEKGLSRIPSSTFLIVKYSVSFQGHEFFLYEILDALVVKSLEAAPVGGSSSSTVAAEAVNINAKTVQNDVPSPSSIPSSGSVQTVANSGGSSMSVYSTTPSVKGVQLPNLTPTGTSAEAQNISLLMDVSMELTVELGRTRWQVKDILGMGEGTIVELDKLAGEPVDILVNHNLIARGEVVVIDENFGVRVTEIVSSVDKMTDRRG